MGSMVQTFLMISDIMGKHGEHGKFMTSNSMENRGKHGTEFA